MVSTPCTKVIVRWLVFGRRSVKRFALCYQTVVLSVCLTLVYFGQTVGWIKMKLGMQVGLSPGHIVLDGDPAPPPPKAGRAPQFSAHICCGQMAGWITMPLGTVVGLSPNDIVLDGDPAPLFPKRGRAPQFSAHICCGQMGGWIKMPLRREVGISPSYIVLDGDQMPLPQKWVEPPNFRPISVVAKWFDGSRCHLCRVRPQPK